jgi:hypothetical protein
MQVTMYPLPTLEEVVQVMYQLKLDPGRAIAWRQKFGWLRNNAKRRGLSCLLSFKQYVSLAVHASISDPDSIGKSKGCYHLSRKGDIGDYVKGNCRFLPQEQNLAEKIVNGGSASHSLKMTGRTKFTHTGLASMVEKRTGRTKLSCAGVASQALKLSKRFKIVSPDGVKYVGSNVRQFCIEHVLKQDSMAKVCAGTASHHKGWTGKYMEYK